MFYLIKFFCYFFIEFLVVGIHTIMVLDVLNNGKVDIEDYHNTANKITCLVISCAYMSIVIGIIFNIL